MHKKTSVIMASAIAAILTASVLAFALPNHAFAYAVMPMGGQGQTTVIVAGGNGGSGGAGGAGGEGGNGGITAAVGGSNNYLSANGGDANGGHGGNANGGNACLVSFLKC